MTTASHAIRQPIAMWKVGQLTNEKCQLTMIQLDIKPFTRWHVTASDTAERKLDRVGLPPSSSTLIQKQIQHLLVGVGVTQLQSCH